MTIFNCRGMALQNHGIYNSARDSIFENNLVYDVTGNCYESFYSAGGNDNNIFRNNIGHDCDNYGIELASGSNQQVYNNVFYHNKVGGMRTGDTGMAATPAPRTCRIRGFRSGSSSAW